MVAVPATVCLWVHLALCQGTALSLACCLPRGPSISSIRGASILVMGFLLLGGSTSFRFTSGGTDTVAAPVRDAHLGLLENCLEWCEVDKAGTRKSGSDIVGRKILATAWKEAVQADIVKVVESKQYAAGVHGFSAIGAGEKPWHVIWRLAWFGALLTFEASRLPLFNLLPFLCHPQPNSVNYLQERCICIRFF